MGPHTRSGTRLPRDLSAEPSALRDDSDISSGVESEYIPPSEPSPVLEADDEPESDAEDLIVSGPNQSSHVLARPARPTLVNSSEIPSVPPGFDPHKVNADGRYPCPFCETSLSSLYGRLKHAKTVHPDKPPLYIGRGGKMQVSCAICHVQFVHKDKVLQHIFTAHRDFDLGALAAFSASAKPTTCPHCDEHFESPYRNLCHMRNDHPDQPSPSRNDKGRYIEFRFPEFRRDPTAGGIVEVLDSVVTGFKTPAIVDVKCPHCDMPIQQIIDAGSTIKHHVRGQHRGAVLTKEKAEASGLGWCPCGIILLSHLIAPHKSRCKSAKRLAVQDEPAPPSKRSKQHSRPPTLEQPRPVSEPEPAGTQVLDPLTGLDLPQPTHQFLRLASYPTTYSLVPKGLVNPFIEGAARLADRFTNEPTETSLLDFLAFPKIALAAGLATRTAKERMELFPDVQWPAPAPRDASPTDRVKLATRLVETGRFKAAMSTLENQAPVAPLNDATLAELNRLHPIGVPKPYSSVSRRKSAPIPDTPSIDLIKRSLAQMDRDTAAGISGWTVPLLRLACDDERVVRMLHTICTLMLQGTCPGRDLLVASRLIPLLKPNMSIRPVAVGDVVYRVCARAIVTSAFKPDMLAPCQLGVGSKGGVEPAILALRYAMERKLNVDYTHFTSVDISNAFNNMARTASAQGTNAYAPELYPLVTWLLDDPSALLAMADGAQSVLWSTEGVRQGDPLAALIFALGARPIIEHLTTFLGPEHEIVAYHDDFGIYSCSPDTLARVVAFLADNAPFLPVNVQKSSTVSLDHVREHGMEYLGSFVGPHQATADFLHKKVEALRSTASLLAPLPGHHAWLLLRNCIAPRLRHLLRTLPPDHTAFEWLDADLVILQAFNNIRWSTGGGFASRKDHLLVSLPIRHGGMGLLSYDDISQSAYQAATQASLSVLHRITPSIVPSQDVRTQRERCREIFLQQFDELMRLLPMEDQLQVVENQSVIGRRFMSVVPSGPHFTLSNSEIASAFRTRTLSEVVVQVCAACGILNPDKSHAHSCNKVAGHRTARHERLKYAVGRSLETLGGGRIRYEPPIPFSAGSQRDRRDDIEYAGSPRHNIPPMAIDFRVSSLVAPSNLPLPSQRQPPPGTDLETWLKASALALLKKHANQKIANHPPLQSVHTFHPFIVSAGGLLEAGSNALMEKWKRCLTTGGYSLLIQGISIGLVRSQASAITAVQGNPSSLDDSYRIVDRHTLEHPHDNTVQVDHEDGAVDGPTIEEQQADLTGSNMRTDGSDEEEEEMEDDANMWMAGSEQDDEEMEDQLAYGLDCFMENDGEPSGTRHE